MDTRTIPAPGATTAALTRCPRCSAPIAGDFKFCPSCAFRLRSDPMAPEPAGPRRRRSGWLVVAAIAAIAGCVVVGILVFHPAWVDRPPALPQPLAPIESMPSYFTPVFTVDQIRDDLIELRPGYAFEVLIDNLPDFPEKEDLRARFPEEDRLEAQIWYPLKVLRYEITRGQYEEFLRDLVAHPERIPAAWTKAAEKLGVTDPDQVVIHHVPRTWAIWEGTRVASWSVPPSEKNFPVTYVSCVDAQEFCTWASRRLGVPLRLPVAMEWVRAARGGSPQHDWPWGDEPLVYACSNLGSFGLPLPVHFRYSDPPGTLGATREGLFSMAGNAAEWALDHELGLQLSGMAVQLLKQKPTVEWRPFPKERPPTHAFAYGGSYKMAIGDCKVDDYRRFDAGDSSREDVGFRVVSVPE